MMIYAITIFLGAFLLFQVQLISAKTVLPWFGGSPAVWTTCNLFFQGLLLAGYAYGHAAVRRISQRAQGRVHALLLLASLGVAAALALAWKSPITPPGSWKPQGSADPVIHILAILLISVGLPYFLLSATGPILQAWLGRTYREQTVYRLYALSNLGSLLALVSYPFWIEPRMALQTQARFWSWCYAAFALACAYCALRSSTAENSAVLESPTPKERIFPGEQPSSEKHAGLGTAANDAIQAGSVHSVSCQKSGAAPTKGLCAIWLGLAGCASVLFLATTNQLCQEIAVIPLLWVLPLSVYLLSFILCFARERWYSRRWFHPAFGGALLTACFLLYGGAESSLGKQIGCYVGVLFVCCMVCHGELAKLKPSARFLTLFYLMSACGGVLGGIAVALLAPHLFPGFWEYQAGLLAASLLVLAVLTRDNNSWLQTSGTRGSLAVLSTAVLLPVCVILAIPTLQGARKSVFFIVALLALLFLVSGRKKGDVAPGSIPRRNVAFYSGAAIFILALVLGGSLRARSVNAIASFRNFYGVLTVRAQDPGDATREAYALSHGLTVHGYQFRADSKRRLPTSYYGTGSGIGLALKYAQATKPIIHSAALRIGVVGLGIGTLAAYGRKGDSIRFYEINPEVIRLATKSAYFTYIRDSPAKVDVISGDGRISLERELQRGEEHDLDVLAIDAFSGDAIPVHLLTKEAFEIYLQRLKSPGGILAIHVSNRFLDLKRVVFRAAEEFGIPCVWVQSERTDALTSNSDWMLLSHDSTFLKSTDIQESRGIESPRAPRARLWTDDYSNLFQVLRKQ
ncbi:MAG TPA: fused MFS/spermidine synthase [Candidatus Dormibacteraeota bacterium]|nr:fused MFS/spermidine synthase [Candidatus Dormibacteraeota bacterium]